MTRKKILYTAAIVLLFILLIGCSVDGLDNADHGENGEGLEDIQLTDANNGDTVYLKVGQSLVITLESNPTTGYMWEVEKIDTAVLAQIGETEIIPASESESEPQLVGQGGVEVLRFQAQSAGEFTLKLVYHQPWEGGDASPEGFSVTIVVSE